MRKFSLIMLLVVAIFTVSAKAIYVEKPHIRDTSMVFNTPVANADATATSKATIEEGAVKVTVSPVISNKVDVKNKVSNEVDVKSINTNAAINEGVEATNTTTVEGDTYIAPVNSATALELPELPQLPESNFNVNDDTFGIENDYAVKQLKSDIASADIWFVWSKVKVTMPWTKIAKTEQIKIISDPNAFLTSDIHVIDNVKYRVISVNGIKYALLGSVTAEGKQGIKMSLIEKMAAYKASQNGADVLLVDKIGFNIGAKGLGFNLFGTGVKVDSDNAVSGGGGFGPSYVTRYFDGGMVGYALINLE